MSALEKYNAAFIESFEVEAGDVAALKYQSIPSWDSVGHMNLMGALEDAFGIELETDDIIDFASYEKGKEILKKYEIVI